MGGVRALRALGVDPAVWHLNEGHSAFLLLERARELVTRGRRDPEDALAQVGRGSVFTIHTPVPAGNEVFERGLLAKATWRRGSPHRHATRALFELGRGRTDEPQAPFDMTAFVAPPRRPPNAVSQLHGATADRDVAGGAPATPIDAITNGVHVATWLGRPMRRLYEPHLGTSWRRDHNGPEPTERVTRSTTPSCGATCSRSAS